MGVANAALADDQRLPGVSSALASVIVDRSAAQVAAVQVLGIPSFHEARFGCGR
jgi:hypothetical protein